MAITRRSLITTGLAAGGGLIVYSATKVLYTGGDGDARLKFGATTPNSSPINAWVKIAPDGEVTFAVHRAEMGQGITTSLPMMLAEEMDADWDRIRYEFSPVDKDYYNFGVMERGRPFGEIEGRYWAGVGTKLMRRVFHAGGMSLTLSSTSIIDAYDTLRPAGAAAREMLIAAAAKRWGVLPEQLVTELSTVIDPESDRRADYGELAADAAHETPPSEPALKDPANYRLIGRSIPRLDIPEKVDGSAGFAMDVQLPDMLFGAVVHSPVAGGRVGSFDASAAEKIDGVEAVVALGDVAVGVLARDTWSAMQAAEKIRIEPAADDQSINSSQVSADFLAALDGPDPSIFREDGDALTVLGDFSNAVEAVYEVPYLAHACMEPMNCTALFDNGSLDVWVGSQALSVAQEVAASVAGIDRSQVTMHRTLLGGGFGRRAEMDFVERAVAAAVQVPGRPVKMTYSREEDIRHDMYRPAALARIRGRLGDDGTIMGLDFALATQSVVASFDERTPSPRPANAARDVTVASGAHDIFYVLPNYRLAFAPQFPRVPAGYWRGTSTSYIAFFLESFMDELAATAGVDPVAFRLAHLPADSRHRGVLEHAADRAGWGQAMGPGRARGIALFEKARNVIAQIVEISVGDDGSFSVDRIVCVTDPGQVIHPDTVVAMMEGGIVYGLTAAITGEITLTEGRVDQSNFHDYRTLPMSEIPEIEVYLLPQGGRPTGVGETAVPGVAPALANAIFAATGERIRRLPIGKKIAGITA
jgi:isoquinoline 1-oxidoreductase beta subunit